MILATAPLELASVYSSTSVPSGSLPNDFFSTFCAPSGEFVSPSRPAGTTISARNPNAARAQRNRVLRFILSTSSKTSKAYYGSSRHTDEEFNASSRSTGWQNLCIEARRPDAIRLLHQRREIRVRRLRSA